MNTIQGKTIFFIEDGKLQVKKPNNSLRRPFCTRKETRIQAQRHPW